MRLLQKGIFKVDKKKGSKMKNMSHISNQDTSDLTEAISFVSKSGIKEKSFVDEVIEDFGGAKISHEEAMEIIRNYPESAVGPEIYAELHPESVIIKKHKELSR